ncbi:hypothetical protein ON010_g15156 [Phytophthora cinnamomi]|nr:hypothetical protein ON010_g15156 [Phytophthora cinnamomi]
MPAPALRWHCQYITDVFLDEANLSTDTTTASALTMVTPTRTLAASLSLSSNCSNASTPLPRPLHNQRPPGRGRRVHRHHGVGAHDEHPNLGHCKHMSKHHRTAYAYAGDHWLN